MSAPPAHPIIFYKNTDDDVDFKELAALHKRCFPYAGWDQTTWQAMMARPSICLGLLFATQGGAIIGLLTADLTTDEGEILTFAIDPDMRRQGCGHKLLCALMQHAARPRYILEVAADNIGAIKLYEYAGFQRIAVRKSYYSEGQQKKDALVMSWDQNQLD